MAGCLGEEAEKTGKGTGRERIWHSAQCQRNGPPTLTFFPIETLLLTSAVVFVI